MPYGRSVHETVNVTNENCTLKYDLLAGAYRRGRFLNNNPGTRNSADYPYQYRVGGHAVFVGEDQAEINVDQPAVDLNGRSFKVQRIINRSKLE